MHSTFNTAWLTVSILTIDMYYKQLINPLRNCWRKTACGTYRTKSSWTPSNRVAKEKPSIWQEIGTLAAECKAVNIGQGCPDSPMPKFVSDLLRDVADNPERADWHQYTRGFGHPRLVNILGQLYSELYGRSINSNNEILVTVGAYLSLYYSFTTWLNQGDEVLIIEPAYDCYSPQVRMAGGTPVPVAMKLGAGATSSADFKLDLSDLEQKCSEKTKMLVLNNPNNPSGKLFTREELEGIAEFARRKNLIVVADEVYEWHVYGENKMIRFASLPGMFERTISIGSAGKAFSVTGWKLGWAIAPEHLLAPMKLLHQNCVYLCSTQTQEAVGRAFEIEFSLFKANPGASYLLTGLPTELLQKRDKLAEMCRSAGFVPLIPDSGYFMLADFGNKDAPFREEKPDDRQLDYRFVTWLAQEKKLAAIPPSAFYSDENKRGKDTMIRLCFMKKDETLEATANILKTL